MMERTTPRLSTYIALSLYVTMNERMDLLGEIITAEDGFAAKRLIKNIKIKDTWDNMKYKVMRKIIALKFNQNNQIRDKLLATKGFLYEATKDLDFGCGLTLGQAKDINQKGIRGKNMLGIIICEYREEILGGKKEGWICFNMH